MLCVGNKSICCFYVGLRKKIQEVCIQSLGTATSKKSIFPSNTIHSIDNGILSRRHGLCFGLMARYPQRYRKDTFVVTTGIYGVVFIPLPVML
jgi:hypothetical protein